MRSRRLARNTTRVAIRSAARAALLAVAAAAAVAGCKPRPPTAPGGAPLELAPLPEPPRFEVVAEPGTERGPLTVVAAQPRGPALGMVRPVVTFSKPVVAMGPVAGEASRAAPATLAPPVAGEWRWLGSASAEFVPAAPLPDGTAFTVTVPAGLRAVDGSTLAEPYVFSFETRRPRVLGVTPRDRWAWLGPSSRIGVTFDRPVAELERRLTLRVGGQPVPARVVGEVRVAVEEEAQRDPRWPAPRPPPPGFEDRRVRYEVAPASPFPLDAPVELSVAPDLHGMEGPLPVTDPMRWTFRTHGPMAVLSARACDGVDRCPYGPLIVRTTNLADPATLRGRVRVEPAVEIDWDRVEVNAPYEWDPEWMPHFSLPGRFRPGVEYRIAIDAGLRDEYGQPAGAARVSARTSDLEPMFEMARGVALLEAAGDGALPVESQNLGRLEATVWPLGPADAARLLTEGRRRKGEAPARPSAAPRHHTLQLGSSRNVTSTRPLPIRQILGGGRSGLFLATVQAPELDPKRSPPVTVIGQITDLAVHAKLGATSGVVWVTRLSDGSAVDGARVAIHDRTGKVGWTGATDAQGVCPVPGLAALGEAAVDAPSAAVLVAASKDGDTGVTLSTWTGPFYPWSFGVDGDWDGAAPRSLGMVAPERGVYRPGQTVHLKGLARYRRLGSIETPEPGTRVRVTVTSSRGQPVATRDVATTAFGTFSTSVSLDGDVPLGTYQVTATAAVVGQPVQYGGAFRVEEYRAPQFRVDVSAPRRSIVAGDPLTAKVSARYLFGGAMADVPVEWTAHRSAIDWSPPGTEGFDVGNQVGFWEDGHPGASREVGAAGRGRTDAGGGYAIEAGAAEAPARRTWETVIEAEVADVNRQRVADRATVVVHPAALYAGVRRRATGFAEVGKPVVLEVIAVTPEGSRPGADVEVVLKRREWKSIRRKVVGDRWLTLTEPVEEPVGQCRARTGADAAECTFTPGSPGLHLVEATVTDGNGRKQSTRSGFHVVGSGWVSWSRDDTDRVEMVADKAVYDVGDTARVLVKSPFPEAEALFTVEREGVMTRRRVRLGGAATTLEVPITDAAVPNVFASIVLVRGRQGSMPVGAKDDPGRPAVRIGYVNLKVERKDKRLAVVLRPDAATKRPRDKVKVDVEVRDAKGRGVAAEVALWAVDDGVLRLTGYRVPDPVEAFHPPRGLSVRVAESLVHLVMRKAYGDKGLTSGGSGGFDPTGAAFRANFRTTAAFLPEVLTDASGRATVEFDLPDNLTTFRILAVAVTRGDLSGSAESSVTVAKPLLVLPALPRLARVGDSFEAGVVVHAPGGAIGQAEVTASATGLVLEGEARRTVALTGGKAREVRFRFRAASPGEASLRFAVAGGGEGDGVEQRIPVVLPVEREAVAVYGDTGTSGDPRREALSPPAGVRGDVGGLEVTMSSSALAGIEEGVRQLVEYPYGCLEQLASRLVPFLALRELQGAFRLPAAAAPQDELFRAWIGEESLRAMQASDPDEAIRKTVKAIQGLQAADGGYRYWPGSACSDELASSWAVLALGRAADLGFPVDRAALARGQEYLAGTVAAGTCTRCGWGCVAPEPATRTFAVWALARTRAPRASYYPALLAERERLPLFARAMLADAMFVGGGDRAAARRLLDEVMGQARVSASEVHLEEDQGTASRFRWSSDVRTTAVVLSTLTDVIPDHPFVPRMASWLVSARGRDGRYRSTQEAAFALTAMTEVVRTREREAPDFTGIAALGGRTIAEAPFQGRSLSLVRRSVPMSELRVGGAAAALEFRRDGRAGVLHYGARLRYAPEAEPTGALERGIFVQRWFEPWVGGGQVRAARAGDLVRVRVRLGTPRARRDVAVEVPVPAGMEVVDTTLASTAALSRPGGAGRGGPDLLDDDGEGGAAATGVFQGFWSPFTHVERRDDRVVLFADQLPPGIHEASFVARATTPGQFGSRPARAEEMYAPEVFGRSDGGTFAVVAPEADGR